MYFVYIIRCSGDRLYTGITTNVDRRFSEHSGSAKGAKFTHAYPPEAVLAVWSAPDRSCASKLEYCIKHLPRQKKLLLISDNSAFETLLDNLDCTTFVRQYTDQTALG